MHIFLFKLYIDIKLSINISVNVKLFSFKPRARARFLARSEDFLRVIPAGPGRGGGGGQPAARTYFIIAEES